MISKEELKKEVDKLPEGLLDEVYALLKGLITQKKPGISEAGWKKWESNLKNFTPDFMNTREQPIQQIRDSFDS